MVHYTVKVNMKQNISKLLCSKAAGLIESGSDGVFIVHKLTEIVDELLVTAYDSIAGKSIGLSLVAVGGYGLGELAPYSDIDIMLLARNRDAATTKTAQDVLYHLWDMGLNISHCFRTMSECVEDAMLDMQIRTSVLSSRFLAGDMAVFDEFKRDAYQKVLFKNKKEFVANMLREIDRRHKTYGDSVYLLEPNIKEGRGGLRDIHAIGWFAKVVMRSHNIKGLQKLLTTNDLKYFAKAHDFLLMIRLSLHLITQRRNDILSFEFHEAVSKMLGFHDTKRFLSSEILMRLYYRKAKNIRDALSKVMIFCGRQYVTLPVILSVKKITEDFYLSKNEIILKDKNIFKNPDKIMEAFSVYSASDKKFSYNVKEALRNRFLFINKKARASKKAKTCFLEILKSDRVYETLREMHDTGILDRFIPEFGKLRHLVIYEPYHRYTVDEHTLIAIKKLEDLKNTKHAKLTYLADILKNVKTEILFLAILLHDIGKGASDVYDSGHEDAGYRLIKGILERFNIAYEERQRIEFLVKNHVELSKLALTRDPDAPETIAQLAELVENEENLNMLYLMTYADMTAVNPDFWTDWKAYLFYEMYSRTNEHLKGTRKNSYNILNAKLKDFVDDMPDRYLISSTIDAVGEDFKIAQERDKKAVISVKERGDRTAELTIIADDVPGLFSKIVGVLGFRGLNILRARLYTGKSGLVVDKVVISNWKEIWWQGMEEQINTDLSIALVTQENETKFVKRSFFEDYLPITASVFPLTKRFESFVEIDNETSGEYSILELFSLDRLGLLYDISMLLYAEGVRIISAVINTEEHIARDVFYLQYNGTKLSSEITMQVLQGICNLVSYRT